MKLKVLPLLFVILLVLSGCKTEEKLPEPKTDDLEKAIDSYIQNEIYVGESVPLMQQYQNAILGTITYKIESCHVVSKTNGTMDVEFTYIDVLNLADSVSDPSITEDGYYSACLELIQKGEFRTITEVIQIAYESSADGYTIVTSDQLINVLSGGMLNYYMEILEDIQDA